MSYCRNKMQTEDIEEIKYLLKNKKWDKVILLLNHIGSDTVFTYTSYYKAYNNLREYSLMEKYLDKLLELKIDNATIWKDKGLCLQRRNENNQALECFSKAIELAPDIASFYAIRGKLFSILEDYPHAIADYKKAVELNTANIPWLKLLGDCLIQNKNFVEAKKVFAKLLKLDNSFKYTAVYHALDEMIKSGAENVPSIYYDIIFKNSEKYLANSNTSIYIKVWKHIIELTKKNKIKKVLDLGCGPGQFAEFLNTNIDDITYTGIDFSIEAISIAKYRCPNFQFITDILPIKNLATLYEFDVVICTEVLEHVTFDIEILETIPLDTMVIASVPNFNSFGHVRYFKSEKEVRERYEKYFQVLSIHPFYLSEKNIIWLMHGIR